MRMPRPIVGVGVNRGDHGQATAVSLYYDHGEWTAFQAGASNGEFTFHPRTANQVVGSQNSWWNLRVFGGAVVDPPRF